MGKSYPSLIAAIVLATGTACGGSTEPKKEYVPAVGRYRYELAFGSANRAPDAWTLVIGFASAAVIAGHWEGQGIDAAMTGGDRVAAGYLVRALMPDEDIGTLNTITAEVSPTSLTCSAVVIVRSVVTGQLETVKSACTLTWLGP